MFLILGLVLFSTVTGQGNVVQMAAGLSTRLASYICSICSYPANSRNIQTSNSLYVYI